MARGMAGGAGRARGVPKTGRTRPQVGTGGNNYTPPPPPVPTRQAAAPAPKPSSNSNLGTTSTGNYAGFSDSGGFSPDALTGGAPATPVTPTPAPEPVKKPPTLEEYLGSDSIYQTQVGALEAALKRFGAEVGQFDDGGDWVNGVQGNAYEQDYGRNLKDLGWDDTSQGWNQDDKLTSYGSSFGNQIDDFASRGMLESSAYQEALNNLLRGFGDQKSNMESSKDTFFKDLQEQFNTARSDSDSQRKQAQAEAALRRSSEYSL